MKLETWLSRQGVTRTKFAGDIGLSVASVSRLAAGLQTPSFATLKAIEQATAGQVTATDFDVAKAA